MVMAHVVTAHVVMAYAVMAYVVMAYMYSSGLCVHPGGCELLDEVMAYVFVA